MSRLEQIAKLREELVSQKRELIEQVTAIRQDTVARLPEMLAQAKQSLEGKLAKVYLAKDSAEAARILGTLLKGEEQVARAYGSTLSEIGFDALIAGQGTRVKLTRLEEIVQKEMELSPSGHPHLLVLDQPRKAVEESLRRFAGCDDSVPTAELKRRASEKIKEDVTRCEFGITGLDCIVSEHGSMVLAEDEGDLRAVSNLPYKHVAVAGLEQLVGSAEEAVALVQAASIFATGRITPTYVSFISGPSRTGDIEFRMAYGMHGPREVHVILLDNGRTAIRERGAGSLLKCLDCGSCYESCAELAQRQGWKDGALSEGLKDITLTAKGLALGLVQGRLPRPQSKLMMREFLCPVGLSAEEVTEGLGKV
jgi:L-lactate utilization protein LutB